MYKFKEACIRIKEGYGIYSGHQVRKPEDAIRLLKDYVKELDRECVIAINLSASNRPINYHIVSIGGTSGASVDIPNIFKAAILSNASSIMLIHNHLDGDATPSGADLDFTQRAYNASKIIGVPLIDHLVLTANGEAWSIRGSNPELFAQTATEWEDVVAEC